MDPNYSSSYLCSLWNGTRCIYCHFVKLFLIYIGCPKKTQNYWNNVYFKSFGVFWDTELIPITFPSFQKLGVNFATKFAVQTLKPLNFVAKFTPNFWTWKFICHVPNKHWNAARVEKWPEINNNGDFWENDDNIWTAWRRIHKGQPEL